MPIMTPTQALPTRTPGEQLASRRGLDAAMTTTTGLAGAKADLQLGDMNRHADKEPEQLETTRLAQILRAGEPAVVDAVGARLRARTEIATHATSQSTDAACSAIPKERCCDS